MHRCHPPTCYIPATSATVNHTQSRPISPLNPGHHHTTSIRGFESRQPDHYPSTSGNSPVEGFFLVTDCYIAATF
jgi:hypothetical protein